MLLAELDDTAEGKLIATLASIEPGVFGNDLPESAASRLDRIPKKDALALIEALLALYIIKANNKKSASELVGEVAANLACDLELKSDEDNRDKNETLNRFKERLLKLMSVPSLELCAKATGLQGEYDQIFVAARILTDIRPIFGNDIKDQPTNALIVHNLKIEFLDSGVLKEIFFALDGKDLIELTEEASRAGTKEETLSKLLSGIKVQMISTVEKG